MKNWRAVALVLVGVVAALFYSNFLLDVAFSSDHDWFAVVSSSRCPAHRRPHSSGPPTCSAASGPRAAALRLGCATCRRGAEVGGLDDRIFAVTGAAARRHLVAMRE